MFYVLRILQRKLRNCFHKFFSQCICNKKQNENIVIFFEIINKNILTKMKIEIKSNITLMLNMLNKLPAIISNLNECFFSTPHVRMIHLSFSCEGDASSSLRIFSKGVYNMLFSTRRRTTNEVACCLAKSPFPINP